MDRNEELKENVTDKWWASVAEPHIAPIGQTSTLRGFVRALNIGLL